MEFVLACANLIAFNLGVHQNRNTNEVGKSAEKFKSPPFKPKSVHVELPEDEEERKQQSAAQPKPKAAKGKEEDKEEQQLAALERDLKAEATK